MTSRRGGFLADIDRFDPEFFGISAREALHLDPQQRLLLEVSWEAIEHAGLAPRRLAASQTGVFIGISTNDYLKTYRPSLAALDAYTNIGNAHSLAASRISYLLDLRGPSMAIELKQHIQAELEIDLPVTCFLQDLPLSQLAAQMAEQVVAASPIDAHPALLLAPEDRYQQFPLNDIQQAYWVGRDQAFELSDVASHIYAEYERDAFDPERLNQAWQLLVQRHGMLRAIVRPDGQQQVLAQVPAYRIEIKDLRELSSEAAEAALAASRAEMTGQTRPMHQWPLFQLRLHRLPGQRMRLCTWFDLLIVDTMSFRVLLSEWLHLYQQPGLSLPAQTMTFRDYVLGEREQRQREATAYARDRMYWHDRLPTLPASPQLCTIQQAEETRPTFLHQVAELDAPTWAQLKARTARAGITPAMVLCNAFAEILTTWSAGAHFTLVLTRFHRLPLHAEVKHLVGDFTSTTLLEVRDEGATFEECGRLQQQLRLDLEHAQVSGVEVLRDLARLRGTTAQARVPVVFTCILNNADEDQDWLEGFGQVRYLHSRAPQIWLDNQIYERGGALLVTWETLQNVFPPGLPQDMFAAYLRLLHRLADDEHRWQQSLIDLRPREQREQRALINATAAPLPTGLLHTPFLRQAHTHASRIAVRCATRRLTYQELERRSRQLRRQLLELGARPNTLVGVVMEKGWEQIVAVLGILRAGAAYLPIDVDLTTGDLTPCPVPYTHLSYLRSAQGQTFFCGGSPTRAPEIVAFEQASGQTVALYGHQEIAIDPAYLARPTAVEFPPWQGETAHAFYYPPCNPDYAPPAGELPPLLVRSHPGPTLAANTLLDLTIQYWTSRGIGVLDVSYGGSTGYGRAYRQRLAGQLGVVDVEDCSHGALHLVHTGQVDRRRIAISGRSAGGYTTLCALVFKEVFQAGACYYGINNLEVLAMNIHKFESHYLQGLVGPYPQCQDLYRARSPINFVARLSCPVIFLQGSADPIATPEQAERVVEALRRKGLPVAYLLFEGEGHGFERAENIVHALDSELVFYARIFGFALPNAGATLTIENLSYLEGDKGRVGSREGRRR
jgi:dienelactone hydrolase